MLQHLNHNNKHTIYSLSYTGAEGREEDRDNRRR